MRYVAAHKGTLGKLDLGMTYITHLTLQYITSSVFILLVAPTVNTEEMRGYGDKTSRSLEA